MLKRLWSMGAEGTTHALRRQIEFTNHLSLCAAITSSLYSMFFAWLGGPFWAVCWSEWAHVVCCVLALLLNKARRHDAARNLLLISTGLVLVYKTSIIGTGSGMQFYLLTMLSILAFVVPRGIKYVLSCLLTGAAFILCYLRFNPDQVPSPIYAPWDRVLFIIVMVGAMGLIGIYLGFVRIRLDQSEDELVANARHLQNLSNIDPLTGLPNRRALDFALAREWAQRARQNWSLTVMMCDIDHFKQYNDHYGHEAGDQCLKHVAAALRAPLQRSVDLVARYGGEEFTVVLPDTSPEAALQLAEKMRTQVAMMSMPHAGAPQPGIVTVSIGVAAAGPGQEGSMEALLKRADEALYKAKNQGRNRTAYLECMAAAV